LADPAVNQIEPFGNSSVASPAAADLCDTARVTPNQFRKIALGFEGAVEASHMGHPDFRAPNGRIFATLNEDQTRGMAALTPEQQSELIERAPEVFVPAAGAWGRGGSTMIVLAKADAEMVGEALTLAYKRISTAKPSRSKPKAKKITKT
jgi:hypothetical protein